MSQLPSSTLEAIALKHLATELRCDTKLRRALEEAFDAGFAHAVKISKACKKDNPEE